MFFTEVKPEKINPQLSHGQKVWTIGSCFADEIGRRMADDMFDIRVNPCGTLYNPASIARTLNRIITGTPYTVADLFEHNGMWHCMDFHSAFSDVSRQQALQRINATVETLHGELPRLDTLMVTFGSARAFIDLSTGAVAGNCHKLPSQRFEMRDFSATEIAGMFRSLIQRLHGVNPKLRIIFTVSPIRHKAYGYHADKLSKATLLIAEDMICRETGSCYFPAYEIMTDELRDYRFYAADMIHPSETAADHIYMRLAEALFSPATTALAAECRRFTRRLAHRPLSGNINQFNAFASSTVEAGIELAARHPELGEVMNRLISNYQRGNQQEQPQR